MRGKIQAGQTYAAVDLGSNSFHLIVAAAYPDRLHVLDKHREMVRLAEGLSEDHIVFGAATERALKCLERFGQRLRDVPPGNVRAVGTNTLRQAGEGDAFLKQAQEVLGHRIEIIGGREEARLVYLGASHALEDDHDWRLVADIGGGSTEIALGQQFQPLLLESLGLGCVAMSAEHFRRGITKRAFTGAINAARLELEVVEEEFKQHGWDTVVGTSGTIVTASDAIRQLTNVGTITLEALHELRAHLIKHEDEKTFGLTAVGDDRAPVFPGGVAILIAIFEAFGVQSMNVSGGALREGLLYDLLGRVHARDIREQTVQGIAKRFNVDTDHTGRVADTTANFLDQLRDTWPITLTDAPNLVRWASTLHEIGRDISHSQYHKHGAYLLDHMDLLGFSLQDQHDLSLIVRSHRRKLPFSRNEVAPDLLRLCVLLRLAVLLHRARSKEPLPPVSIAATESAIELTFPEQWLAEHPLTTLDLAREADYLKAIALKLRTATR